MLDAGVEEELRIRHLQVADATRASLGLPVVEYIVTDTPLEVLIKLIYSLSLIISFVVFYLFMNVVLVSKMFATIFLQLKSNFG